ncbi:MAG: hypothetical protein M3O34_05850 [Chloroflexota bacterium]|nr:hypothetical protein [Chloroflexota bacterium]
MCGIAGYVGRAPAASVERMVGTMCGLLAHRGPDHAGVKVVERAGLAFGVGAVRLKVRDLSAAGNQPMAGEGERHWIVYNGEVYNSESIRAELEARGHVHCSRADTETVLHGFEEWGVDVLRRLDGMFAFAVVDGADGVVTIARDRMGIKPLYYTLRDGALLFASELKALVRAAPIPLDLDPIALDLYLALGYVPVPHCLVAGVRKLPAGSVLTFDGRDLRIRQYWSPAEAIARADRASRPTGLVELTRATVERAIRGARQFSAGEAGR